MLNYVLGGMMKLKEYDISEIDLNEDFFHYTNKNNLVSISKNGLEPRIGANSLYVEKSKKVFFAKGRTGIITIIDVWLRWLTANYGFCRFIYGLGTFYMRLPFCFESIPNYVVNKSLQSKKKRFKVYKQMQKILDDSVFLVLDLENNIDFSYDDIDEVKDTYYESFLKMLYPNFSDLKDKKIEYWNMHTYSNKKIDAHKVSVLKIDNLCSASVILKK